MKSPHLIGVALVCISAFVFSTAGIFTKGVETDAWGVIFWRGLSAAILTISYTIFRGTFRGELSRFGFPALLATVLMASGTAAFIPALKLTSIANVSLIWAAAPFVTGLLAWLALRERPEIRIIVASVVAISGVAILVAGSIGEGGKVKGDILALWMTFMMSGVMVVYRKWPETPAALPAALASLVLLPFAYQATEIMKIPSGEFSILIGFGFIFAIASVTLNEGVRRIPAAEAALLGTLETPLGPILAFLFLSEIPKEATLAGGAVILIAVFLSQVSRKKSNKGYFKSDTQ